MSGQSYNQPYSQLVDVKRWADRGLCDVLVENFERLSKEDAFIMLRILDHFHTVDKIFQHHLLGQPHHFNAPRSETMPEFHTLVSGIREVDDWYASYTDSLNADDFSEPIDFTFTSGKKMQMQRGEIILHICLHGTYHRGNAGALLQLRGLTPSRDAITDFLEEAA